MNKPDEVIQNSVTRLIVAFRDQPDLLGNALTVATEQAIRTGILAERERCAKIAESHHGLRHADKARFASMSIAAAIRSTES